MSDGELWRATFLRSATRFKRKVHGALPIFVGLQLSPRSSQIYFCLVGQARRARINLQDPRPAESHLPIVKTSLAILSTLCTSPDASTSNVAYLLALQIVSWLSLDHSAISRPFARLTRCSRIESKIRVHFGLPLICELATWLRLRSFLALLSSDHPSSPFLLFPYQDHPTSTPSTITTTPVAQHLNPTVPVPRRPEYGSRREYGLE
ncbi:hypothetical protein MSAN_00832300 [Mycena sanguinolenta]|uniref:Uncharacterized protein n=1 Tax=Mycena sanguinolenta TaxID=230812 RepID=A0A8H6Z0L8_9AGAR|nr:hypothetical protein MSAN_00832300 [Mycena sanguinolenta]